MGAHSARRSKLRLSGILITHKSIISTCEIDRRHHKSGHRPDQAGVAWRAEELEKAEGAFFAHALIPAAKGFGSFGKVHYKKLRQP